MSEPRPELDSGPDRDVWDSPAWREYEADPAAYRARAAARYAEYQAAEAAAERARAARDAAAEARFWEMREAEHEAEMDAG